MEFAASQYSPRPIVVQGYPQSSPTQSDGNHYRSPVISPGSWNVASPASYESTPPNVRASHYDSPTNSNPASSYGDLSPSAFSSSSSSNSSNGEYPNLPAELGRDGKEVIKNDLDKRREKVAVHKALKLMDKTHSTGKGGNGSVSPSTYSSSSTSISSNGEYPELPKELGRDGKEVVKGELNLRREKVAVHRALKLMDKTVPTGKCEPKIVPELSDLDLRREKVAAFKAKRLMEKTFPTGKGEEAKAEPELSDFDLRREKVAAFKAKRLMDETFPTGSGAAGADAPKLHSGVLTARQAATQRFEEVEKMKIESRMRYKEEKGQMKPTPKLIVPRRKEKMASSTRKAKKSPEPDFESIHDMKCQLDFDRQREAERRALRLLDESNGMS